MKAVIVHLVSTYGERDDDHLVHHHLLGFQRGKRVHMASNALAPAIKLNDEEALRPYISMEVVEELPNYPAAHKLNALTERDLVDRKTFEERAEVYILHKYEIPYLMDFDGKRDWGWISREGIYYSNGYARHSATATAVTEAMSWQEEGWGETALFNRGFIRVTPYQFSWDKSARGLASKAQVAMMDRLILRWVKKYGRNEAREASYSLVTGLPYA